MDLLGMPVFPAPKDLLVHYLDDTEFHSVEGKKSFSKDLLKRELYMTFSWKAAF